MIDEINIPLSLLRLEYGREIPLSTGDIVHINHAIKTRRIIKGTLYKTTHFSVVRAVISKICQLFFCNVRARAIFERHFHHNLSTLDSVSGKIISLCTRD